MSRDGDFNRSSGNPGRRRPVPSPSPLVQAILLAVGATALALLVMQVTAPRWSRAPVAGSIQVPAIARSSGS